jgi:hypothetical protein
MMPVINKNNRESYEDLIDGNTTNRIILSFNIDFTSTHSGGHLRIKD